MLHASLKKKFNQKFIDNFFQWFFCGLIFSAIFFWFLFEKDLSKKKKMGKKKKLMQDYDYLFKILLIGDSGVGKTCILMRFSEGAFETSFITTIGVDFKIRTIEMNGKRIKLQLWDTAGQERFQSITQGYYRGAKGIMMVYDVTDEISFSNIRSWSRRIEHYSNITVSKVLIGNKVDLEDKRVVSTVRGKALADEFQIPFVETSAKTAVHIEDAFTILVKAIFEKEVASVQREKPITLQISEPPVRKCCY
jgi:Ras-related protein Rab-8A